MFFALIFMTAASAWNIFSGYSGYLALGHAVFFGTGGYARRHGLCLVARRRRLAVDRDAPVRAD